MRDEVPHGTAVDIEKMREREGSGILDIEATIYCEKESHKGMIIGRGGASSKRSLPKPARIWRLSWTPK